LAIRRPIEGTRGINVRLSVSDRLSSLFSLLTHALLPLLSRLPRRSPLIRSCDRLTHTHMTHNNSRRALNHITSPSYSHRLSPSAPFHPPSSDSTASAGAAQSRLINTACSARRLRPTTPLLHDHHGHRPICADRRGGIAGSQDGIGPGQALHLGTSYRRTRSTRHYAQGSANTAQSSVLTGLNPTTFDASNVSDGS
jgi:hypothetical protein